MRFAEAQEAQPTPDLRLVYGNEKVTLFGQTGTIDDLIAMCPVDLTSPDVSLDTINEVVIKGLNESGNVIKQEHEQLFTETLERSGQERKFRLADPGEKPVNEKPRIEKLQSTATEPESPAVKQMHTHDLAVNTLTNQLVKPERVIETKQLATTQAELEQAARAVELLAQRLQIDSKITVGAGDEQVVAVPEASKNTPDTSTSEGVVILFKQNAGPQEGVILESPRIAADVQTLTPSTVQETDILKTPDEISELFAEAATETGELSAELIEFFSSTLEPNIPGEINPIEERMETAGAEVADWGTELEKAPLELLDDFSAALELYVTKLGLESIEDSAASEEKHTPPVLLQLSERLAELEDTEKELVAPIVQNIIGAIHGLGLLEERGASAEMLIAVETQLEGFCISLFEVLGMTYNPEELRQFVTTLTHPDFQPAQTEVASVAELNLELDGMREVKTRAHIIDDTFNNRPAMFQLLGKFVLLYVDALKGSLQASLS